MEGGASGKDLAETGGKRKRRVRWAPDSVLCSYRFIEPRQTEVCVLIFMNDFLSLIFYL